MPPWLLALAFWLHMVATVAWLGGLFFSAAILDPVLTRRLAAREQILVLVSVRRRFEPLAWLSLAILVVTGLAQMTANPNYQGTLVIANRWSLAILAKHVAVALMILAACYQTWFVRPRLERMALLTLSGQQAGHGPPGSVTEQMTLSQVNLALSLVVLALTALARTA